MSAGVAELIKRLEEAKEGSRELDCDLWVQASIDVGFPLDKALDAAPAFAPYYTTSIDAALSLVPEGMGWNVGFLKKAPRPHAWVGDLRTVYAASVPLALCIAALKARQP